MLHQTLFSIGESKQAQGIGEEEALHTVADQSWLRWKASDQGWAKANWDAVLEKKYGKMGFGVIIQGYRGMVIAVCCRSQRGLLSPSAAKAMACLLAVQVCSKMGPQRVHLEGDAKGVIKAIMSSEQSSCREGHSQSPFGLRNGYSIKKRIAILKNKRL